MARNRIDHAFGGDEPREPEDLAVWLAQGFAVEDAELWRRWRFPLDQAHQWIAAGVSEGLAAAQWQTAGAHPASVQGWIDANITPTEAVNWHEFGFGLEDAAEAKAKGLSPADAHNEQQKRRFGQGWAGSHGGSGPMQKWMNAGIRPDIVHTYLMRHRDSEDDFRWAKHNIDAGDTDAWQALGLTPEEAGRLAQQDKKPGDVMREWWGAGIPLDEVAEWIGAGLTADEAADQRARGITAEHAAALRALRIDDDES